MKYYLIKMSLCESLLDLMSLYESLLDPISMRLHESLFGLSPCE